MEKKEFSTEGLRSFEWPEGEGKEYFITIPNADIVRKADWEYSLSYTKSLVEGITTSAEMTDILTRRGIIGPEFEQRSQELADILTEKVTLLSKTSTRDEKELLAREVAKSRDDLFAWNQRLNTPMANTCEALADDARLECLTALIIADEAGEPIWNSFESYLSEDEQGLSQKARYEVMVYMQGLNSDFLENTPEALAMKELEQEALDAVMQEIEDTATEEAEKATKKTKPTAKKKAVKKVVKKAPKKP